MLCVEGSLGIMMEFGAFLKTFEGMWGLFPYFLTQKFVKNDKKYWLSKKKLVNVTKVP